MRWVIAVFMGLFSALGWAATPSPAELAVSYEVRHMTFPKIGYVNFLQRLPMEPERKRQIIDYLKANGLEKTFLPSVEIDSSGRMRVKGEPDRFYFKMIGEGKIAINSRTLTIDQEMSFEKILALVRQTANGGRTGINWLVPDAVAEEMRFPGLFASMLAGTKGFFTQTVDLTKCMTGNLRYFDRKGPGDPKWAAPWSWCSPAIIAGILAKSLSMLKCDGAKLTKVAFKAEQSVWGFDYVKLDGKDVMSKISYFTNDNPNPVCETYLDKDGALKGTEMHRRSSVWDECYPYDMGGEMACCQKGRECTDLFNKYSRQDEKPADADPEAVPES